MKEMIRRYRRLLFLLLLPVPLAPVAQGLIIPSGGYMIAANGNIVLYNNWVNNGVFTHRGGTLFFAGTTQTLGGTSTTTFNNITIAAGSRTSIITPGQLLAGVLQSNDTLNANGDLTLLSTAAGTAQIDGSGTGEVLGNLTMQRYLTSGFGYYYFSSPFKADTVNDFSSVINLGASFPDFYSYNENLASAGWVSYINPSGLLTPLQGYAVNFGASMAPVTVALTGVVSNHTLSTPTLFNHNMVFTQGFNLVGNPYPSPVDWNAASGWVRTNIDNAIYFFNPGTTDQYTGVYSSYINGVSSDGVASNLVAAMQGFFIHVSNGTFPVAGQLTINNNARIINPTTTFLTLPAQPAPLQLLRLNAGFADETTAADPTVLYFAGEATGTFNKQLDALKMMNTDPGVPDLYIVTTDATRLSIHALLNPHDSLTIVPLGLTTAKPGWITFRATDLQDIPGNLYVYLHDAATGANQDLRQTPLYRLYLGTGEYEGRFFLNLSTKELPATNTGNTELFKAYSAGGKLYVNANLPSGEKGNLVVFNTLGQAIWRQELNGNTFQQIDASFITGIYIVSFSAHNGSQAKKIWIGPQ